MKLGIGIDTGGTYTDAVLVNLDTGAVMAQAKALTTRHQLSIGIEEALQRVLPENSADVHLVSLSTTLATNALVEGQGRRFASCYSATTTPLAWEARWHRIWVLTGMCS